MIVVQQGSPGWSHLMEVLEKYLPDDRFLLRKYDPSRTLPEMVFDSNVIILGSAPITKEVFDAAPKLEMIHQHGRGVDSVDLAYATKKGVYVCNIPAENAISVAEHAMFLILALAKKYNASKKSFEQQRLGFPPTQELKGKTLGIVGLGASGKELAQLAKGFRMRIIAVTEHPDSKTAEEKAHVDSLAGTDRVFSLLGESDFVSLHVPLNAKTRGMVNKEWFDKMRPTANLINVARGGLVDKADLYQALVAKKIAGAGLDVFWQYPPDPRDPLFQLQDVLATPHMAGFTAEMYETYAKIISENIQRLARREMPLNIVNREVIR